ncbi:hypothetical protein [Sinorhizobium meliloti]|uniref:hypothetical protein n=1 Tax=Rhizobium meliloti TaxID=382 RepID=UPI0019132A17|nr:hypothetical protein [Sinorhizobium meliloti]
MTDRPAIKPLEWKKIKVDGEIMFRARKPFGSSYYITELLEAYDWNGQTFDTIEAAKAAAQSDYESRIRSCLLDKPEAVEGEPNQGTPEWHMWVGGYGPDFMAGWKAALSAPADTDAGQSELDRLRRELEEVRGEAAMLQDIIDSRPAINAGLPETYIRWSQSIYSGDAVRAALQAGEEGR